MITTTTRDEGLLRYINLKLAALAQPTSRSTADPYFLEIAGPLLRNHYQKDQLLGDRLCPVDARIQTFLDAYLAAACPAGAPRLPANTFVLDRPGLARAMSLPPESDSFSSPYLHSYRVPQGVLHNPKNDRRTTQGVFHIVEGGLPIPADKIAVPVAAFAALLAEALRPPADVLRLPFTADQERAGSPLRIAPAPPHGLSGNGPRPCPEHGDPLFRPRQPGQQSRFRRRHLRECGRPLPPRERRRAGRPPLDRPHRLRDPGAPPARNPEKGRRPPAIRCGHRTPAPRRNVLARGIRTL